MKELISTEELFAEVLGILGNHPDGMSSHEVYELSQLAESASEVSTAMFKLSQQGMLTWAKPNGDAKIYRLNKYRESFKQMSMRDTSHIRSADPVIMTLRHALNATELARNFYCHRKEKTDRKIAVPLEEVQRLISEVIRRYNPEMEGAE